MNRIETWNINQRRIFDPDSVEDMQIVKKYLYEMKWNNCPFYLEWPYLDIPSMIKDKITEHTLNSLNGLK
jgi:hypothetical protein